MKKSQFSKEQIIGILKEDQAGERGCKDLAQARDQRCDVYAWPSKYRGMEVSDTKLPKSLEEESRNLKKLLAESMLDVATLREALGKTSDARSREESRELGNRRKMLFAAARL